MKPIGVCLAALVLAGRVGSAQTPPSPAQAQQALDRARQDPALAAQIRERIRSSGLTADQIRARLRASGYSETLLDAYLGGAEATPAQPPGALELGAIRALGLPPIELAQGLVPIDTGFINVRAMPHSRVFGVDVFQRSTTQFLPLLSGPVPSDYRMGRATCSR